MNKLKLAFLVSALIMTTLKAEVQLWSFRYWKAMKRLPIAFILVLLSSFVSADCTRLEARALEFANSYIDAPVGDALVEWLLNSQLVTTEFVNSYQALIDAGFKNDPSLGLGYDPITVSQDVPEKYEVKECITNDNTVMVRGVGAPQFNFTIKLVNLNGIYFVEASGHVNHVE